jgi:hypothetical protein
VESLTKSYGFKTLDANFIDEDFTSFPGVIPANSAFIWDRDAGEVEKDRRPNNLMAVQRRLSWLRMSQWAFRDKKQFGVLLERLSALNDGLRDLLPSGAVKAYERYLLIHQPEDLQVLDMVAKEVTVIARFVAKNYALAANMRKSVAGQALSPMERAKLRMGTAVDIKIESMTLPDSFLDVSVPRVTGTFEGDNIFVEFKDFGKTNLQAARVRENRIKALVSLLQTKPKPPSYRLLDCCGFTVRFSSQSHGYGLVFKFPDKFAREEAATLTSLETLLPASKNGTAPMAFSYDARISLAATISASVAELHAADWLHYNITSSNILCFSLNGTPSLEYAYLSGFEFDGYDDPKRLSEPASLDGHNNYWHPDYQLPLQHRAVYRKTYDLYSLGILLLEILLWRQVDCYRQEGMDASAFREYLLDTVVPLVGFSMGEEYEAVVRCCLDPEALGVGDGEGKKLTEAFSRQVVGVLERRAVGIEPASKLPRV